MNVKDGNEWTGEVTDRFRAQRQLNKLSDIAKDGVIRAFNKELTSSKQKHAVNMTGKSYQLCLLRLKRHILYKKGFYRLAPQHATAETPLTSTPVASKFDALFFILVTSAYLFRTHCFHLLNHGTSRECIFHKHFHQMMACF